MADPHRHHARLAVLAAVSVVSVGAVVAVPGVAGADPSSQPRALDLVPRALPLQPRVVDLRPKAALALDTDVLFAFGSAALSPTAAVVLQQVVPQVTHARGGRVVVTGYTDNIGTPSYNLALSQRRAAAVRAFLAPRAPGVTITAVGKGEANPVAPNTISGHDNPEGRRRNRRVTFTTTQ